MITAGEKEKKGAVCEPATSCTYFDLLASFGKCSQHLARLHLLLQVNRVCVCRLRHLHSASHHTSGAFCVNPIRVTSRKGRKSQTSRESQGPPAPHISATAHPTG